MHTSNQLRRILLFSLVSIKAIFISAQSFTPQSIGISNSDYTGNYTSVIWGDCDNDNDLDIARFGPGGTTRVNRNDLTTFTTTVQALSVQNGTNAFSGGVWADMNNDGFLDLLFTSNGGATNPIYKNNGDGTLTLVSGSPLGSAAYGNLDVADVDADGDLDVMIVGAGWSGISSGNGPRILLNNGNFLFTASSYPNVMDNIYGSSSQGAMARFADFTNDGLPDVIISNNLNGGLSAGNTRTQVYANNGNGFVKLYDAALSNSLVTPRIDVGDVDNDGWIDFVMTGGADPSWSTAGFLFKNVGGTSFTVSNLPGTVYDGSVCLGDMDNDGDLDLNILGGPSLGNVIYVNNGSGTFSGTSYIQSSTNQQRIQNGTSVFGDYDNDGRLDLFSIGSYSSSGYAFLLKNPLAIGNSAPNYPTALTANVTGANVDFSWSAPSDDHTPSNTLSYNIMVGTSTGGMQIVTPHSDPSTGYRRIPKIGNAYLNKFFKLKNMKPGVYYWAVQAIDNGFRGSTFAVGASFTIPPSAPGVADVAFCKTTAAAPLTATPMPGGTLRWWDAATGGNEYSSAPTPSTASAGTFPYWVSQVVNGVEGPRAKITVTINSQPNPPIVTSPVNYCVGQTAIPLSATGTALLWYPDATTNTPLSGAPTPSTSTAGTTSYYVTQTVTNCESPSRAQILVNVYAVPSAPSVATPVVYCQGDAPTALIASGSGTINWWGTLATGGTASGIQTTPTTATPGSVTYYVTQTLNGCESTPRTAIVVNVNPTPVITTQPAAAAACEAATVSFSTAASGGGSFTYQWQVSTDGGATYNDLSDVAPYSGVITATLAVSSLAVGLDGYYYRCKVTNSLCPPVLYTTGRKLTVLRLAAVTASPTSVTICEGDNTSFTAAGTGYGTLSYQWQISTNSGTSYVNLTNGGIYSGIATPTLTLTGTTVGSTGAYFRCKITSGACLNSAYTTPGVLTVNANIAIGTQPSSQLTCVGNIVSFSLAATGFSPVYQWQVSTDGGTNYTNLTNGGVYTNVTTSAMTITGATAGMDGYYYRCIVSGPCGAAVTSSGAKITVRTAPAVTSQPVSQTICSGGNTTFSITATGTSITYQWQFSADGTNYFNVTESSQFVNVTSPTLTVTGVNTSFNNYFYRCQVLGPCSPNAFSNAANLVVNALPAITAQPTAVTTCVGSNISFSVTGTGLSYLWMISNDNGITYTSLSNGGMYSNVTTPTLNITGATTAISGKYFQCVITGACNPPALSTGVLLTVNSLPAITTQPVSSTICAGGTTSFTVAGTGTSIGYKWEVSTDNGTTYNQITNGGVYSNATTASLTITGTTTAYNGYYYRCQVYGVCSPAAYSTPGILTVNPSTSITGSPANSTICEGATTSFAVAATGVSLSYQWQISTNGGSTYGNLSNGGYYTGVTTATLGIANVTTAINNYYYRCVVTGTCVTQTSSGAKLTVNTYPAITTQPVSVSVCPFTNINYTTAATGTGVSYLWQFSPDGVTAFTDLANGAGYSGVTTGTLTITSPSASYNGYNYRCKIIGTCSTLYTNPALVNMSASPGITTQPTPSAVCGGTNANFSIVADNATTYQWQESSNGSTYTAITNGGIYSGATAANLVITGVPANRNGYYYRCVASGACTPAATSNGVTLTVGTLPSITTQPVAQEVCTGDFASFSVEGAGGGLSYQWQSSLDGVSFTNLSNGGGIIGALTANLVISANINHNGKYIRCVVSGSCNPSVTSSAVLLTVNSLPSITAQPNSASACIGASATFNVVATGTGLSYKWQESTNGGASYTDLAEGVQYANVTTNTLSVLASSISMNNNLYRCLIGGTCASSVNSTAASLTVNMVPAVSSTLSGTACSDVPQSYLITGVPIGTTTFTWSRDAVAGIANAAVTNQISNPIAESLTNTTGAPVNVTYVITPISSGCTGLSYNYVVTVNTAPSAPTVTSPVSYCKGASAVPLVATSDPGCTLRWYDTKVTGGVPSSTATVPSTVALGNTSYYVAQEKNGCESLRSAITVTVNGTVPVPVVATPPMYCAGATALPLAATPDVGATLNWYGTNAIGGIASSAAPTPSTSVAGLESYYVSQSVGECESPRATISVRTYAVPSAPAVVASLSYCQNATSVPLTANSSGGAVLNWYGTAATGGTANASAPTPATNVVGTITYYVSQSANGCESSRSAIAVTTLSSIPLPTVSTGISYCQNGYAAALSATASGAGTLLWYGTNATGGTASTIAPFPSTLQTGTTLYYVSQKENGCESPRASISITVNPLPKVDAGEDLLIDVGNAVTLNASGDATSYSWNRGGGNGVSFIPEVSDYGYYVVTGTLGSCTKKDSMFLVVRQPNLPEIGVYYDGKQHFSNTDDVNIGKATVTQGPFKYTFTIDNRGGVNLNIGNIVLTGQNSSSFSLSKANLKSVLKPDSSTTFDLVFMPLDTGVVSARLTILNDDQDEGNYIINIYGYSKRIVPSIAFATIADKEYSAPEFELIAVSSNGKPITFMSSNPTIALVNGSLVTPLELGEATITASIAEDNVYEAVTESRSFKVKLPGFALLGSDYLAHNIINAYLVYPYRDYFTYKWVYNGDNITFTSDTLGTQILVYAGSSTTDGDMKCLVYNAAGELLAEVEKPIIINHSKSDAYSLATVACTPAIADTSDCFIKEFSLESLDSKSGSSNSGITDFTQSNITTDLFLGESYSAKMKVSKKSVNKAVGVWIDFNNNGEFDQDEYVFGDIKSDTLVDIPNIRIPNIEDNIGSRRLRVKVREADAFTYGQSCIEASDKGEAEDYIINLKSRLDVKGSEAMTPNGDGKNDCFVIRGINPKSEVRKLQVFDVLGNVIYSDDFYENDWCGIVTEGIGKGKLLPIGTYYYVFQTEGITLKSFVEVTY